MFEGGGQAGWACCLEVVLAGWSGRSGSAEIRKIEDTDVVLVIISHCQSLLVDVQHHTFPVARYKYTHIDLINDDLEIVEFVSDHIIAQITRWKLVAKVATSLLHVCTLPTTSLTVTSSHDCWRRNTASRTIILQVVC